MSGVIDMSGFDFASMDIATLAKLAAALLGAGAAAGSTSPGAVTRRSATGARLAAGVTAWAFVWPELTTYLLNHFTP